MKKAFLTLLLISICQLIFAQSITFSELVKLLRSRSGDIENALNSKGFSVSRVVNNGGKVWDKQTPSYGTESIWIGYYLTRKDDTIKHYALTYVQHDLAYMIDLAKSIPTFTLKQKDPSADVVTYYYESDDFYLQISMSKDPQKNPYGIILIDKKSKRD